MSQRKLGHVPTCQHKKTEASKLKDAIIFQFTKRAKLQERKQHNI